MQAFLLYIARLAPAAPQSAPCGPQISLLRDRKQLNRARTPENSPQLARNRHIRAQKSEKPPLRDRKLHNRAQKAGCFVYAGESSGYVPESSSGMVWDDGAVCRNWAEGRQWQNWAVSRDRAAEQEGAVVRRDWVTEREGQQWRRAGNGRRARAAWRRRAGNGRYAGVDAGKSLGSWGERGVVFLSTINYICNMR